MSSESQQGSETRGEVLFLLLCTGESIYYLKFYYENEGWKSVEGSDIQIYYIQPITLVLSSCDPCDMSEMLFQHNSSMFLMLHLCDLTCRHASTFWGAEQCQFRVPHGYTVGMFFSHRTHTRRNRTHGGCGYIPTRENHGLPRNPRYISYPWLFSFKIFILIRINTLIYINDLKRQIPSAYARYCLFIAW